MRPPGVLKKRTILFTSGLLVFMVISLGLGQRGWAVIDEVKTFGLVEKTAGTQKTETANFNDGSIVYVRVHAGSQSGGFSSDVKISAGSPPAGQIYITVYDDGTFPDDKGDDKYYWGKFTLREGDGSGTDDPNDIIEVKDTETAEIEADIDGGDEGTAIITAAYGTFSDHTSPGIVSLSVNPSTFSPNGDGIDDTTIISFALGDESSSLYTRIEVRDSSKEIVRNLLVPKDGDNPLSTGSYSKIWDGKDRVGVRVSDAAYTIYIISLDEDVNSSLRTIDVIVDTEIPEVLEVNVSPGTISPQNVDGNYDSTKITFKAMHFEGGLTFKIIKDSTQYRDLSSNINWETDHWAVSWDGKNEGGIIVDGGDYTCEIVATNASSVSTTDTTGAVSVDNTPPPAPTNLSAMAIAGGSIKLTWTASSPETDVSQYNIYRATSSEAQNYSSPTYTVSSGTATYTDTSTIDGVTYYYVVRAQDAVSNIETNTNEASAIASATGPSFSSISADKSAYKDGDTITLTVTLANHNTGCTLTANFSNIDDQYATGGESVVDWGTDGVDNDGDGHIDNLAEQGVYVISYLISLVNATADGSHSVPVTATDAASNSASSSISLDLDNTAPPSPTNLSATAVNGGDIQLTWTASSPEDDVANYNIYRATTSGGQNYSSYTYQVSSGTTAYTDTATINGTTYYYVVRAQDAVGNTEINTDEASATAGVTEAPSFSSITADSSGYKDGDTITLTVTLANHNTGCTLTANFSNIDSQYVTGGESIVNWGTDGKDNDGDGHIDNLAEQGIYVITYLISTVNGRSDASCSVSVTATDAASNSASSSISLTLDNTIPSGSISINNDATYTNSRTVTLTLSATNATQMQFSNDASSWSDWEDYSTTKSWTLSSGDGKRKVYVKFKHGARNVSEIYSDHIILDRTPPTASITSPSADTSVKGQVVIRGTASDENFKEYKVEYGQGTEPSDWTEITSSASEVTDDTLATWDTTVLNDGSYTLRLTTQDLAGNSARAKVSLRVDNHPPEATLIDYPTKTVSGNTPKVAVIFTWRGSDPDGITPVEKLVYQYKIEGHLDYSDWSDWSSETTKTYMLPLGSYTFKVRAKDEAGSYPEEDDPATAKSSFTVSLPIIIYPNPCYLNQGQIVTIANLPLASEVKIYIYDLGGNLIRTLGESEINIEGGSKTATWDCRNDNGEVVAGGVYIYFIPSATEKKTGKIAIIK